MTLTPELLISVVSSVLAGATVAWLGNRVANAELYGHVRRHCKEISHVCDLAEKAHSRLGDHREKLAVLWYEHERRDLEKRT